MRVGLLLLSLPLVPLCTRPPHQLHPHAGNKQAGAETGYDATLCTSRSLLLTARMTRAGRRCRAAGIGAGGTGPPGNSLPSLVFGCCGESAAATSIQSMILTDGHGSSSDKHCSQSRRMLTGITHSTTCTTVMPSARTYMRCNVCPRCPHSQTALDATVDHVKEGAMGSQTRSPDPHFPSPCLSSHQDPWFSSPVPLGILAPTSSRASSTPTFVFAGLCARRQRENT